MFNASDLAPDMSISVSLGDFHSTHDKAHEALALVKKGMDKLTTEELRGALAIMNAGQRLTDAETGSDSMWATSYSDEIALVRQELKRRESI